MLGNRLFGLPPEGDTHRQPLDEVFETADIGQLAAGLQSVVGPQVQLKEVFQKTPPVATACPVVVSKQRHRLRAWAAESTRTTISRVAQAVS